MKKIIIALSVVALIVGGVFAYKKLSVPKSTKIYEEYYAHLHSLNERRFMEEPGYRWDYQEKADKLREKLADAYYDENNTAAIPIYEEIIADLNKPHTRLGIEFPVTSAAVKLQAIYYEKIALIHERNQNVYAKESALKKAAALEKRASKMK